jgi:hypothetical protein
MFSHENDLKFARFDIRVFMRLAAEFQALYPFSAPLAFAPGNELQTLVTGSSLVRPGYQALERQPVNPSM